MTTCPNCKAIILEQIENKIHCENCGWFIVDQNGEFQSTEPPQAKPVEPKPEPVEEILENEIETDNELDGKIKPETEEEKPQENVKKGIQFGNVNITFDDE